MDRRLLVVAVLVSLPSVVGAWHVSGDGRDDAAALLARVRAASITVLRVRREHRQPGPADGGQLSDVASLLGGRTQQRVWWAGRRDWRADTLSPTGE